MALDLFQNDRLLSLFDRVVGALEQIASRGLPQPQIRSLAGRGCRRLQRLQPNDVADAPAAPAERCGGCSPGAKTIRVTCLNPRCGAVVEATGDTFRKVFARGYQCPVCAAPFGASGGTDHLRGLMEALDGLTTSGRCEVEFTLPTSAPV